MNLVDVHCHINHEQFKDDLDETIERAKAVGVKRILVSGVNPESNQAVLKLIKLHPDILRASLGIYPIDALGLTPDEVGLPHHEGKINLEEEFEFLEKHKDQITAIGEVGMDFHWADKNTQKEQEDNFRKIIQFAIKIKKPIIIHSRKAEKECIDILEEEIKNNEIPVSQHCFSGKKVLLKRAAELGHYFSVPANILKSSQFETMVKLVPITQLLTETDAPWLTPFSGKRNEPAFIVESIKKIAKVKDISEKEAADQVWVNYQEVFND
jgi:TatD DNase family protein